MDTQSCFGSDETGRWAGNVTIEDLPLYAYNNEDAAHWIQFLIREHVTGYTTAESVEQLLDEFVSASPFSWLDETRFRHMSTNSWSRVERINGSQSSFLPAMI